MLYIINSWIIIGASIARVIGLSIIGIIFATGTTKLDLENTDPPILRIQYYKGKVILKPDGASIERIEKKDL